MNNYIRLMGLLTLGLLVILHHQVSAQHHAGNGASAAPTTAEMEFEAEEMTTTTTAATTTTTAPKIAHKRPAVIGENCPMYKYTISEDKVEFHTLPNQCKIVVQFPPERQGPYGYGGKRGPPRVQYMARFP